MNKSSQIVTGSAVVFSCISLGLSAWAVGCGARDNDRATRTPPSNTQAARTESPLPAAPSTSSAASAVVLSPAPIAAASVSVTKAVQQEPARLRVKRLVVARGVSNHEPTEISDTFQVENRPLYAFVELENASASEGDFMVTFEKGAKKTGMVELSVPGNAKRWRTWGQSRGVKEAGSWFAVVRDANGKELARTPFAVES